MKKLRLKLILLGSAIAVLAMYSCKKFLNKPPVGSLSQDVLASKAGLDQLLIGAYSMLDGYGQRTTSWESSTDNWIWGSVAADDAYKGSNTTDQGTAAPIQNHSLDPSNEYVQEKYAAFYDGVTRANDVLRLLPVITDGSVSPEYAAEVTAEARFLRGVYHLEMAKVFRNAPYADETITYAANNYNVPNPGPIWDKIEADFTAAMTGLPKTQAQIGRANYYAAEALLAKALMFDHKYSEALPLLTDLIDNGNTPKGDKYALGPFEDNFDPSKRNGPEGVFQVQMTTHDGSSGQNGNEGEVLNFPAGPYTSCCGFYQPSYSLGNAYKVDANGLPMLGTTTSSITVFNSDNKTTSTVSADLPNYDVTPLATDHSYTYDPSNVYRHYTTDASGNKVFDGPAFTPPGDPLDPRIDWTLGRRGIPYLDWGLCGGEEWSRGDIVAYNPLKNLFWHNAQATTADNGQGWANNQDVGNNYNLVRFADVILWRAECEVEGNDLAGAQADVNRVRDRMASHPEYWVHKYIDDANPAAGFTNTPAANYHIGLYGTVPSTSFATNGQDYARAAVYMERQLELAMEGHRFFDLQRYDGLYGGPGGSSYMANILNNYIKADTRIANPVLDGHTFTAGKNELYPLPQHEIDVEGGALVQNPNY